MGSKKLFLGVLICLFLASSAFASVQYDLDATLTADNHYALYMSTDENGIGKVRPDLLSQNIFNTNDRPYDWETPEYMGFNLVSGVNNYMHIIAWDQGVIGGLLGTFNLNNPNFSFDNHSQTLNTNISSGWSAHLLNRSLSNTFGAPLELISHGLNGTGIWNDITGAPIAGINPGAEWIWTSNDGNGDVGSLDKPVFRIFTARINAAPGAVAPEPVSSALFLLGGGALVMRRFRRKENKK